MGPRELATTIGHDFSIDTPCPAAIESPTKTIERKTIRTPIACLPRNHHVATFGGVAFNRNLYLIHSPRSGSTIIYLTLINATQALFIPNLLTPNQAPEYGDFILRNIDSLDYDHHYENSFGKTPGLWHPSEGSAVFRYFFGGAHPSQELSSDFLPMRRDTYLRQATVLSGHGRPFITKNAWNSFRIQAIKTADPTAIFLWVKRDIFAAARSELNSRHFHGDLHRWSSATTANLEALKTMRPAEQALEQHVGYSTAIETQFSNLSGRDFFSVWFEDFTRNPSTTLTQVSRGFDFELPFLHSNPTPVSFGRGVQNQPRDAELCEELQYIDRIEALGNMHPASKWAGPEPK